jgi:hypothetical protein
MSINLDTARARLRAADPADPVDPHDASARAMRERILTGAPELAPVRMRTRSPRRRRLVLAGSALAGVAATVTAGVVTTPWSHGHPANAAFAVTPKADGSISVVVRWRELRDPAALNAKLARLHARTVVIRRTASCHTDVVVDPAHNGIVHVDLTRHSELRKPGALAAYARALQPWITYGAGGVRGGVFTIHPQKIPAGDTLLVPYEFVPTQLPSGSAGLDALIYGGLLVPEVPPCVPTPEHSVYTEQGVRSR